MTEQNLIKRLNFQGDDVLLDGKVIFSVPHRYAKSGINLLGVSKNGRTIYIGSGQCCYGPITILINSSQEGEKLNFQLDSMRMPDFNVYDIIPANVDYEKTGFFNADTILTTGYGCAGSGVRLISTYTPKTIEIVSEDEYQKMCNSNRVTPRLNVVEQEGIITLDLLKSGYRLKPVKSRDPNLPSVLLDSNAEEWYVSQDVWMSKDLTPVLNEIGVNIEKTIEVNSGYTRIRH